MVVTKRSTVDVLDERRSRGLNWTVSDRGCGDKVEVAEVAS